MRILVLVLLLLSFGTARADAPAPILSEYARINAATRYKFLEGMLSCRTPDFKAFDKNGKPLDLRFEKRELGALLGRAIKVEAKTTVLEWLPAAHEAVVAEEVRVSLAQSPEAPVQEMVLFSRSRDSWVETKAGWKMQSSRILEQSLTPAH